MSFLIYVRGVRETVSRDRGAQNKKKTPHLTRSLSIIPDLFLAFRCRQPFLVQLLLKLAYHANSPGIVPHNRSAQRLSCLFIPAQGRLPLIGDTNTFHAIGAETKELEFLNGGGDTGVDAIHEVLRFMLVPIGMRVMLRVFRLMFTDDFGEFVEDDETCGAVQVRTIEGRKISQLCSSLHGC